MEIAIPVKVKRREEEKYKATPKALFALALLKAGLVTSYDCKEVDIAWEEFAADMSRCGYIKE